MESMSDDGWVLRKSEWFEKDANIQIVRAFPQVPLAAHAHEFSEIALVIKRDPVVFDSSNPLRLSIVNECARSRPGGPTSSHASVRTQPTVSVRLRP